MNNTFKKLAAAAMAFTLLGTGTAVTKTVAPQFDNTIVASADTLILNPYSSLYDKDGTVSATVVYYPGIYSRLYTNVRSKAVRYYRRGERLTLKTKKNTGKKNPWVFAEDDSYVWGMTTSGTYIPILYKSVNSRIYK